MKKNFFLLICAFALWQVSAQENPNDGFMTSRVTTTERNNFINPMMGLLIFNTTTNTLQLNIGSGTVPNWQDVLTGTAPGTAQTLTGGVASNCFLPSRVSTTTRNAFTNPAKGLIIYNTSTNTIQVNLGTGAVPDWKDVLANTTINNGSLALTTENPNNGFALPRLTTAERNALTNPSTGTIFFNTSTRTLQTNLGTATAPAWNNFNLGSDVPAGTITTINCAGATNNGTLTAGTAASGVSSIISYTGGNGGSHSGQTVTSTGVTGLTATLAAGNFATGAGNLTYNITGTPSVAGTASFAINIGGHSCTLTRTVANITIPATITLAQNRSYIVASVFDQDYLPFTAPTGPATTTTPVAADGSNETVTVNVQGSITTTGVAVTIPVTATGSSTLPAFSQTITIPASMTEDGIARDLTLSWASQAYTSSTTTINATIAAVGGTLNAKKLDINAGIGNDALGVLMGQFTYPYNNAGLTTTYSVRNIAGVPDKMFGLPDNNSNSTTHMMLYLPMVAADGNIWLNNNLGAHYSNINHASFNLAQQATSATDHLAYGSLLQWGRKPDGHELITWTNGTTGTAVNGTTGTQSNNPANALFITGFSDWRTSQDNTLWATEASANNPCPVGYKVPTNAQLTTLVTSSSITNSATAASSAMKFTVPGIRILGDGSLNFVGSNGRYWSSSVSGTYASYRYFNSGGADTSTNSRAPGFSVRCLKD